ncbi:MAG: ABC transporter substrate-binding protein [Candidatus Bathyarchaeota archaeon]|jgi:peptide/nickel transport system substrate-binding protein|nr:ABC transporter substrate-binding protein [Candidatus Bathyarchaeota archaeon]
MYKNCYRKMLLASMLAVLLLSLTPISIQTDGGTVGGWGPRVDYLQLIIYPGYDQEYQAFKDGLIDVMDWPLTYESWYELQGNPDYVIENLTMWDSYPLDLNCLNWPTSDYRFRKAIAYLVPYEDFYTDVLHAFAGELMDSMVWSEPDWSEWYNPSAPKYWYAPDIAVQILENAGYKNWDADPWLEWKAPNGTIFDLPPLEFYAREDDPLRAALGQMLATELEDIGIDVNLYVVDKDTCWAHAYCMPYDYHIYTEGLGPYNNLLFFYDYWHSQFADPTIDWAWNNVFFMNSTYDYWITRYKYASDLETSKYAFKKALAVMMDQVPLIPVYHAAGASAYRAKYGHHVGEETYWDMLWNGFPNVKFALVTAGVSDWWTFLNAHPDDVERGGVLRFGMLSELDHINPITQYSTWDMFLATALYGTLIIRNPFTGEYIPWFARNWTIGTWDNEGETATKITFNLFENLKWSDGNPLTSEDVAFTMKYMYDTGQTFYPYVEMIDDIDTDTPHIETPDPYTITIYFSVESIWFLEMVGFVPIVPKHVWESIPPDQVEELGEYVTTGNLTGSGPYVIAGHEPNQWWLLRANPYFFRYSPFHDISEREIQPKKTIIGQGYKMNITVTVTNIGDFYETTTITLYANTTPIGNTNLNLESLASQTITFTWDTSGYAKGNYTIWAYVEPVPGETYTQDNTLSYDMVLVTVPGDINGDRKVDVKDLVLDVKAYGSYPSHLRWNPNADINSDNKVDVKDLVLLIKNYGQYW